MSKDKLAIFGGPRTVCENVPEDKLFGWPYVNQEIEDAVLDVIRRNAMSSTEITVQFEKEFAEWQQRKYGIAYCNGTLSLQSAMFGIGLGAPIASGGSMLLAFWYYKSGRWMKGTAITSEN